MMHTLTAQVETILPGGGNWSAPTLGGIIIAVLLVLAYLMKLWVDERKENAKIQSDSTVAIIDLTKKTTLCIDNNTTAIQAVKERSDGVALKLDDIRDRLLRLRCMADRNEHGNVYDDVR